MGILLAVMRGIERERECGNGAEYRDTVVRTVIFAFASLAAWWCCSNVASADEVHPTEHLADHAASEMPGGAAPSATPTAVDPELAAPEATEPGQVDAEPAGPDAEPAGPEAEPEVGPVLFPVVVAPLVDAVTPAVAPGGEAIFPVLDAVTTPAAPVLQTVMPVADRVVGPVVSPAAAPAVDWVRPVVEQVAASAAPFVQLVAPAVVPVVKPVTGVVAPVVDQVVSSVADPLVGMTRPALRTVLELDPRYLGMRPATADFPVDPEPTTTLATAPTLAPAPAEATAAGRGAAATTADDDAASARAAGPGAAVVEAPAAAEGPTPAPSGRSFPGAFPQRAVVMTQGSPDSSQRSQRLMAVLSSSSGQPEPRTTALWRTPVESPLARFGGRPPVTPD